MQLCGNRLKVAAYARRQRLNAHEPQDAITIARNVVKVGMAYPETVASHAARTELCSGRGVRERGDGNFFEMGQGIRKDCLR